MPLVLEDPSSLPFVFSSDMLGGTLEKVRLRLFRRNRAWLGDLRDERMVKDNFVPAVGGPIVVSRGLLFGAETSDGCGGGVARCISSRNTYVPDVLSLKGAFGEVEVVQAYLHPLRVDTQALRSDVICCSFR